MSFRNTEIMDTTRQIVFLRGQELRRKEMSQRNTTGRRSDMPVIPDTTLCCIDCYNHALSVKALRHCMKLCGFEKVIFDAKYGEFLGAHMIGANVTEMIAEVVAARKLETTGHEIIKTVHPHPTMSEAIMEAAAAAYGEVIHI
jgi:hypothetical protein